jgi:hypothetical protein
MSKLYSAGTGDAQSVQDPLVPGRYFIWVGLVALILIGAIYVGNLWFLNFVHVLAGVLWTGIDLFMGFIAGPVIRSLALEHRRAVIVRLMPKMLLLMPTLSITTSTAGWFLSVERGYLDLAFPEIWWFIAALAIVTVLTIQGLGMLLPTNIRVLLELRKPEPDFERIGRWMRLYVRIIALQAVMQVAIILVMARFVTGL